jgi:hypothetical protein
MEIWRGMISDGSLTLVEAKALVAEHIHALETLQTGVDLGPEIREAREFLREIGRDMAKEKRDADNAARPPPLVDPDLNGDELVTARVAFEDFFTTSFGAPGYRLLTGMETVVGTENGFFWVEWPRDPKIPPGYYHSDIAEKWRLFRAGWISGRKLNAPA